MCTLLLRFAPDDRWPLLAGAVRDEFLERPWDAPARHWDGPWAGLIGGRDRTAGGTWLAVDPERRALAALLNGVRRPPPEDGEPRPTRGELALRTVATGSPPDDATLTRYDGFHLVLGDLHHLELWSWDGDDLVHRDLPPGDHIVVNGGPDAAADPLVPHFTPLLAAASSPDPRPGLSTEAAWGTWLALMAGDGLEPDDPRALIVRRIVEERTYGSSSAALVGLSPDGVRYDFTADPGDPGAWYEIDTATARTG